MKKTYTLEIWRWNFAFDSKVDFTSLKAAKKAMAEISRSEGRTLAFLHQREGDGFDAPSKIVAGRDWYSKASWKPMTHKDYCEVLKIIFEYPAYQPQCIERQAA